MKEIITAWILLVAMMILFFINSITVTEISDEICKDIGILTKVIESENLSEAEGKIEKLSQKWKTCCKKLMHIFSHIQLEEIECLLVLAEAHIINSDFDEAIIMLEEIRHRVETLEKNEKITLDNIF